VVVAPHRRFLTVAVRPRSESPLDDPLVRVDLAHADGRGTRILRDPGMNRFQFSILHNGTPADPFDDPDSSWRFEQVLTSSTGLNELDGRDFCDDLAMFLMPEH
jgi:hypothetical protein